MHDSRTESTVGPSEGSFLVKFARVSGQEEVEKMTNSNKPRFIANCALLAFELCTFASGEILDVVTLRHYTAFLEQYLVD